MWVIWKPILSPTGDRIVGKRQTGARAEILDDLHSRISEQHDESLEAFEKRVKAAAEAGQDYRNAPCIRHEPPPA